MIKIDQILKKKESKMLLQIHDELIFECLKRDENEVKKIVKQAMISVLVQTIICFQYLEVSINSGNNWGEAIERLNFDNIIKKIKIWLKQSL